MCVLFVGDCDTDLDVSFDNMQGRREDTRREKVVVRKYRYEIMKLLYKFSASVTII